jgi:hypothetical protein
MSDRFGMPLVDVRTNKELIAEITALKQQLEEERLRLAACGVAALGYFDGCKDEYRSASLEDTLKLYAENQQLKQQLSKYEAAGVNLNARVAEIAVLKQQLEEVRNWSATLACANIPAVMEYCQQLEQQNAELRKDAERYRWLKQEHFVINPVGQVVWKRNSERKSSDWVNLVDGNDLDNHIDAAIASAEGK